MNPESAHPVFDLIVIGGGVNGAGIARDAAGRGARVLLLEKGDLASGTSSKSTKLVHGGLRYLEHGELALVREALRERETLWQNAPHIVWPLRFVLPVTDGMRPAWMLRAGLFLYDRIGGHTALPRAARVDLGSDCAGAPLEAGITSGFEYSDAWVDDARLVVLNAVDARRHGALVHTRCPVTALRREGDGWQVETGSGRFAGRAIVNAAGAGADAVARLAGTTLRHAIRKVRGSHIVVPKLFDHDRAYLLQQPDKRICFAIPYEGDFTLIGTTDEDHAGGVDDPVIAESETRYLCDAVNRYFRADITPGDVVWSFSGVRALVDEGHGQPETASRSYRLELSDAADGAPMLDVFGGKITSYRQLAQTALGLLGKRIPALDRQPWTADAPLPGGDFPHHGQHLLVAELAREYPFLAPRDALRLARTYGLDAVNWLGDARSWDDLGRHFGAGLSEAEVIWLQQEEWAQTIVDIIWRRTKLGLRLDRAQQDALAEYLAG